MGNVLVRLGYWNKVLDWVTMNLRNLFLVVLDDGTLRFGSSNEDPLLTQRQPTLGLLSQDTKKGTKCPGFFFRRALIPLRISHSWSNVSSTLSPNVITLGLQVKDKHFGMAHKPLLLVIISVCELLEGLYFFWPSFSLTVCTTWLHPLPPPQTYAPLLRA